MCHASTPRSSTWTRVHARTKTSTHTNVARHSRQHASPRAQRNKQPVHGKAGNCCAKTQAWNTQKCRHYDEPLTTRGQHVSNNDTVSLSTSGPFTSCQYWLLASEADKASGCDKTHTLMHNQPDKQDCLHCQPKALAKYTGNATINAHIHPFCVTCTCAKHSQRHLTSEHSAQAHSRVPPGGQRQSQTKVKSRRPCLQLYWCLNCCNCCVPCDGAHTAAAVQHQNKPVSTTEHSGV